jgi:hypothetical protein
MNKQLPMANPEIRFVSGSLEAADQASTFFARIEALGSRHAIERYAKEHPPNRVFAHEHFTELKNVLAICAASNERIGMAGPVDAAW